MKTDKGREDRYLTIGEVAGAARVRACARSRARSRARARARARSRARARARARARRRRARARERAQGEVEVEVAVAVAVEVEVAVATKYQHSVTRKRSEKSFVSCRFFDQVCQHGLRSHSLQSDSMSLLHPDPIPDLWR
jgi:hypothetical protein